MLLAVAVYDRIAGRGLVNGFGGGFGGDFLAFYTAGHFVAQGKPEALSDPDAQLVFQERVIGSSLDGVAVWANPPYFAWLFAPVAQLPYVVAFLVCVGASLFAVWASLRQLGRELGLTSSPAKQLWRCVQYYPALNFVLNGQTTGLWLTLFTLVFLLLRRGRDFSAGLLFGCFACKPPLALGLAVALVAAGRYRALAGALASSAGLVALGFLTLPGAMHDYVGRGADLVGMVRANEYNTAGLHGSFEFATLLFDGISRLFAAVMGVLVTLALLALTASLWRRTPWSPSTPGWDLRMAATFAFGVIASPHLFVYDLTLLLLPLVILTAHFPERDGLPFGGGPLLELVAVIWALGLLGPALAYFQQLASRWLFGFPVALQPGVVAIFVAALFVARLAERASADQVLRSR